ncbi:amidase [Pseudoclavibacter chungangensis]|uniref:Amidase n=1 Tax=Pseudoclavibacter chungangensis TaxID=587635 RepID=A0A7J5BPK6_9MICO|nr:amidase [Pseudoclavibacter chungangensis]KAB1655054.1 amidase [Pseudoclavibacter chungangensis]NYJ66184.1 amidase [Pseudoclavibacter chungangensis]
MTELHERSAVELRRLLARGELTASELTRHGLDRLERANGRLRAFTTITRDRALERAARLDAERAAGDPSGGDELAAPLWGLPFGDKDLVARAGVPTSYGSVPFVDVVADHDDLLVTTMDAAGGVSLGKTNCPEFGFPSYTENRIGPPARNPWDERLGPGGSSGGAAVAVAAGLLPFAPGSDGGGSIRIPAAACGLVGLKPSRGRVPGGSGVGALAGLPVAGPIARSVADTALLLDGMIGPRDATWPHTLRAPGAEASYLAALERTARTDTLRIAVSTWSPWAPWTPIDVDDASLAALDDTARLLERLGHRVERIGGVDDIGYAEAFRAVWQGGAAALPVDDETLERVEPLTRWLVGVGRALPAGALAGALGALAAFESRVVEAYSGFDAVLTPALAMSPRPLGWYDEADGERNFEQQVRYTPFTSYVNVSGLPAISMPVAADPLPVGVQAIGRPGDEIGLLRLAAILERELEWQNRRAPGWA